MSRWAVAVVVVALQITCYAVPLEQAVNSSADAFVRSMAPGENYGAAGGLAVSGSSAVNGQGQQMGLLDSFIRFDTSSLVSTLDTYFGTHDWYITKAVLTLTEQGQPNNPIFNRGVSLFEVRWIASDAWGEGTGTPQKPTTDGVVYNDEPSILNPLVDASLGLFANQGANGPVTSQLSLAPSFAEDIRSGGLVSLFLTAGSDSIGFTFNALKVAPAPQLVITAEVPEPATIALLLTGVCVVAGRGIRRRNGA